MASLGPRDWVRTDPRDYYFTLLLKGCLFGWLVLECRMCGKGYMLKVWWGLYEKDLTWEALKDICNLISKEELMEAVEHKNGTNSVGC